MPDENTDKQAQDDQATKVAEVGRFAAMESGDNAIAVSDESYIGTDPIYQNYANETEKPTEFVEDEAEVAKRVQDSDNERGARAVFVNPAGQIANPVHPSERTRTGFIAGTAAQTQDSASSGPTGDTPPTPAEAKEAVKPVATEEKAPQTPAKDPAK